MKKCDNILKCKREDCVGCGACAYTCPKKAIKMKQSSEGFLYPSVEELLCIKCNMCNAVCPGITKQNNSDRAVGFAAQLKDSRMLKKCASGGAFWGIASSVIQKDGVVFGAKYTGKELVYSKADTISALQDMVGSKYYQCRIGSENYQEIVESTKQRLTLVSGTPCMISAIKNLKSVNADNLITFEILCQGVPDKCVIEKFYKEKENKKGLEIEKHYFRSKDQYVGRNYLNKYEYVNGTTEYLVGGEDPLTLSFQRQIFLRESCYRCRYANEIRVADFTVGDLWEHNSSNIDIKEGCSVILCNTEHAKCLLEKNDTLYLEEIDVEDALKDNIPYHRPVRRPTCRNWSYMLLNKFKPSIVTRICCYKYYIKRFIIRSK